MAGVNLYLCVKRATTPWTWYYALKTRSDTNKLYYSQLPVPGIYVKHKDGNRYLVAVKENLEKDGSELLVPTQKQLLMEENLTRYPKAFLDVLDNTGTFPLTDNVSTSLKSPPRNLSSAVLSTTSRQADEIKGNNEKVIEREINIKVIEIEDFETAPMNAAGSSQSTTASLKSKRSEKVQTTIITGTTRRVRRVSEILYTAPGSIAYEPEAAIAYKKASTFSSIISTRSRGSHGKITGHITAVDIHNDGYRFLCHSIPIEYSHILDRWLFTSAVMERTIIVKMCKRADCIASNPGDCGHLKIVDKMMFCLDDSFSWVVVERKRRGGMKMIGTHHYCIDGENECMRVMTDEELNRQRPILDAARSAGRQVSIGKNKFGEPDYTAVIKYLGPAIDVPKYA